MNGKGGGWSDAGFRDGYRGHGGVTFDTGQIQVRSRMRQMMIGGGRCVSGVVSIRD